MVALADGPRPDGGDVAAAAGLRHRDRAELLAAADRGQVLRLERLAARPVEVGLGHERDAGLDLPREPEVVRVADLGQQERRDLGGVAGVDDELDDRPPAKRVREPLVVLDAQEAERAHARPDGLRDAPGGLPLLDVGHHVLLDEAPQRLPEHLVLLVEDPHGLVLDARRGYAVWPHVVLTASRSTAPSAVRGRASANTTTWGRLKRAIFEAT